MAEEISLARPRRSGFTAPSEPTCETDITVFNDILSTAPRSDADFEALKTALQAVHPFVPSVFQSEYYFICQRVIQQNCQCLGVFSLVLKTFSNRLVHDQAQIYAIAYEIECKIVRRITQKPINIVFSVLDFNVKPGLQQIGVQHTQQIDQQLN